MIESVIVCCLGFMGCLLMLSMTVFITYCLWTIIYEELKGINRK